MILKYNYHVIPGHRSRPGFVHGSLYAHWSPKERAAFMPRLVPIFGQIGGTAHFRSRPKCVRFVHSSPLPLQKDCGSVKASWTERRRASQEMGQPESLRHRSTHRHRPRRCIRQFERTRGPVVTHEKFLRLNDMHLMLRFLVFLVSFSNQKNYQKQRSVPLFTQH
jgi:hypothetical protein